MIICANKMLIQPNYLASFKIWRFGVGLLCIVYHLFILHTIIYLFVTDLAWKKCMLHIFRRWYYICYNRNKTNQQWSCVCVRVIKNNSSIASSSLAAAVAVDCYKSEVSSRQKKVSPINQCDYWQAVRRYESIYYFLAVFICAAFLGEFRWAAMI